MIVYLLSAVMVFDVNLLQWCSKICSATLKVIREAFLLCTIEYLLFCSIQVYGMFQARSTYEGMLLANENKRPFVLTRAAFIGSHRYAATWTGDNLANWEHLWMSIPMTLNLVRFEYYFYCTWTLISLLLRTPAKLISFLTKIEIAVCQNLLDWTSRLIHSGTWHVVFCRDWVVNLSVVRI